MTWDDAHFPRVFQYRRQRLGFQWQLILDIQGLVGQEWIVKMFPQWDDELNLVDAIISRDPNFCERVNMPAGARVVHATVVPERVTYTRPLMNIYRLSIMTRRSSDVSPPTLQWFVEALGNYVRELSAVAEGLVAEKRTKD